MSANESKPHPVLAIKGAHVSGMAAYDALVAEAEAGYGAYWARLAREFVAWKTPFTCSLDMNEARFFKWFEDGTLNVSYDCLGRRVERGLGGSVEIIFEADDGRVSRVTYSDLPVRTCKLANAQKARGVKVGDRVASICR